MFTGIITDIGEVIGREGGRFAIRSNYDALSIDLGASIACDGVCLTVTSVRPDGKGSAFTLDVSNETLSKTTLGEWMPGRAINLERALKAGDELGGHIVSGHVDGLARIQSATPDGDSVRYVLEALPELARFIRFGINLIPHTLTQTTWGRKKPGDLVNLEIDMFARYVARLLEFRP